MDSAQRYLHASVKSPDGNLPYPSTSLFVYYDSFVIDLSWTPLSPNVHGYIYRYDNLEKKHIPVSATMMWYIEDPDGGVHNISVDSKSTGYFSFSQLSRLLSVEYVIYEDYKYYTVGISPKYVN